MGSNKSCVQPLDLGSTLHKVNFGHERFALTGYSTRSDIFTSKNGKNGLNKPFSSGGGIKEKALADNSLCAARFIYSLEYLGSDADPERDLLSIMSELYRVCCDGALIEVRCAGEHSPVRMGDPLKKRSISAQTWTFFDREARQSHKDHFSDHTWAEDERMSIVLDAIERTGVNFKLLNSSQQISKQALVERKIFQIQSVQQLQQIIAQAPEAVISNAFYLVCVKEPDHAFALASLQPYPPFAMRIYDDESEDIYVSKAIRLTGAWEPGESKIVLNICQHMLEIDDYKDGFKVVNIGANIGWYCSLIGRLSPKIHIDAFEPTPKTLELLSQNLQINALNDQVKLYPCALSDSVGSSELYLNEHNAGGNSLELLEQDHDFSREHTVTIKTETLESLYASKPKEEWPDFIIIDTEGHEQKVWDGAKKLFDQGWRPVVFTEFSPLLLVLRGECNYYKQWIEQYHYQPFVISRQGNNPTLIAVTLDFLQQRFDELKENNKEGAYLDLFFVPEHMAITNGKLLLK